MTETDGPVTDDDTSVDQSDLEAGLAFNAGTFNAGSTFNGSRDVEPGKMLADLSQTSVRFRHRCMREVIPKDRNNNMRSIKVVGSRGVDKDTFDPDTTDCSKIQLGEPTALQEGEALLLLGYIEGAQRDSNRFYTAASWNRRRKNWTTLILTIILGLTAGGSLLYNLLNPSDENETHTAFVFRITVNILTFIALIIRGMQQVFKYDEKGINYEMVGDDYNNYAREWIMKMAQGVDDRREKCLEAIVAARHSLREIELGALPL